MGTGWVRAGAPRLVLHGSFRGKTLEWTIRRTHGRAGFLQLDVPEGARGSPSFAKSPSKARSFVSCGTKHITRLTWYLGIFGWLLKQNQVSAASILAPGPCAIVGAGAANTLAPSHRHRDDRLVHGSHQHLQEVDSRHHSLD